MVRSLATNQRKIDEKGVITVFIADEHLQENKIHKPSSMLLYIVVFILGIAVVCAIKTLLQN